MLKKDLPTMTRALKDYVLEGLARAGLTLADCTTFFAKHRTEKELYFVKLAKDNLEADGELEIDPTAQVSLPSDEDEALNGAYVSAWVWVQDPKKEDF